MARTRRQFARLDLSASIAKEVDVFAMFAPTEERIALLEQFRDDQTSDKFQSYLPFVRILSYTRNEMQHYVTVMVYRNVDLGRVEPAEDDFIRFAVHYDTTEVIAENRKRSSLTERAMIDLLAEFGMAEDVWGAVDFRVCGIGPDDLWFPLPTKLASERDPEALFEMVSIQGARLDSNNQTDQLYRFTLSHFGNGNVDVNLSLGLDQVGPDMGRTALNRATKFLPDLVARPEDYERSRRS